MDGLKDILGIWIGENESASFWLGVCNDLKNRGAVRQYSKAAVYLSPYS